MEDVFITDFFPAVANGERVSTAIDFLVYLAGVDSIDFFACFIACFSGDGVRSIMTDFLGCLAGVISWALFDSFEGDVLMLTDFLGTLAGLASSSFVYLAGMTDCLFLTGFLTTSISPILGSLFLFWWLLIYSFRSSSLACTDLAIYSTFTFCFSSSMILVALSDSAGLSLLLGSRSLLLDFLLPLPLLVGV